MTVDETGPAAVVSTSASHENFAGLSSNDSLSEWEHSNGNTYGDNINDQHDFLTSGDNNLYSDNEDNNNSMSELSATTEQVAPVNREKRALSSDSTMHVSYTSSLIVAKSPLPILPSAGLTVPAVPANNTVPEFLYQLTKMLTGGHNEIIEWSNGRIEVHNPHKLESTVLQKYFRHSKFASFQRQLNYFGFRKLAGKGKMAPCSYVNEAATQDIGSLLLIKRKATANPREKGSRKSGADKPGGKAVHPPLTAAQKQQMKLPPKSQLSTVSSDQHVTHAPQGNSQHALAQSAVGRGIRHSLSLGNPSSAAPTGEATGPASGALDSNSFLIPVGVEDSLSQLASNYQSSLVHHSNSGPDQALSHAPQPAQDAYSSYSATDPFPSLLSRNSSLIDLAMIPSLEDGDSDMPTIPGMHFVDFPQPEVDPSKASQNEG